MPKVRSGLTYPGLFFTQPALPGIKKAHLVSQMSLNMVRNQFKLYSDLSAPALRGWK
jgi:hypothetical protein